MWLCQRGTCMTLGACLPEWLSRSYAVLPLLLAVLLAMARVKDIDLGHTARFDEAAEVSAGINPSTIAVR